MHSLICLEFKFKLLFNVQHFTYFDGVHYKTKDTVYFQRFIIKH